MRFILVHGGNHGAWCWERVIPELERRGHQTVAIDLPGHGHRRNEISTAAGYRDAVVEVLEAGDVLVGHSMGFWVSAMAADAFADVRHIVSLAGPLPYEGQPVLNPTRLAHLPSEHAVVSADGLTLSFDREGSREFFYNDCTLADAEWAFERLTPQRMDILMNEPVSIPNFWSADLPRSCIQCLQDRVMTKDDNDLSYDRTVRRLGVEPLIIDASHSPFISRPGELAEVLLAAVETTPIGPLLSE